MMSDWQARMRKQQEQARRRKAAAWTNEHREKRRRKGRKGVDLLLEQGDVGASQQRTADEFRRAEAEAAALRDSLTRGRISEKEHNAMLRDLMVQDDAGMWWCVGGKSGQWYQYSDGEWKVAAPPHSSAGSARLHLSEGDQAPSETGTHAKGAACALFAGAQVLVWAVALLISRYVRVHLAVPLVGLVPLYALAGSALYGLHHAIAMGVGIRVRVSWLAADVFAGVLGASLVSFYLNWMAAIMLAAVTVGQTVCFWRQLGR